MSSFLVTEKPINKNGRSDITMHTGVREVKCSILRGGTSKGVYILENELPTDPTERDKVLLALFGSPDKRQIDGLGGADPLTSKLALVGPSKLPDVDIEYTFGQVAIEEAKIFYHSMCGNITSGVGPFAINMGLVKAEEPVTKIKMYNLNTGKIIRTEVPVKNGKAVFDGDYSIAGVPGSGAKITVDFAEAAGALTGKLLPTGHVKDELDIPGIGRLTVSVVDCAACQIYVRAKDVGLEGTESPKVVDSDAELLKKLETIRSYVTYYIGLTDSPDSATKVRRNTPHLSIVSPSKGYFNHLTGEKILAEQSDFLARMMFMQIMHKTYAGTGSICLSVASRIPGTLVYEAAKPESRNNNTVRFGHPAGIIEVEAAVSVNDGVFSVTRASIGRTARMIMDGTAFVRESDLAKK